MANKTFRKDRFMHQEGDISIKQLPCNKCKYYTGDLTKCKQWETIPVGIQYQERKCPLYKPK